MRWNRLQNKVATSKYTLPVATLLTTLLWCAEGIYTPDRILGWAVCGLTAYFWVETNNAYSLIRIRSRLIPAVYLWMTGCIFSLHPLQDGLIVSCLMLVSYYLLFKSYQRTEAVSPFFHSFLCIGIGSLFFPGLLFFAPFYLWYAATYLRSLTWRTFWAAMTGLVLPYWFTAAYFLYTGNFSRFTEHFHNLLSFGRLESNSVCAHLPANFRELILFQPTHYERIANKSAQTELTRNLPGVSDLCSYLNLDFRQICAVGLVAVFTFVAALHCMRTSFNDKIRTRMFLYLILTQELLIALFMVLQPAHFQVLLALLVMNSAPILSHYFALSGSRFARAVFVLFLFMFAALSFLNTWVQWSTF